MASNPFYDPKAPAVPAAVVDKLVRVVVTKMRAQASKPTFTDAELKALHPALADDVTRRAVTAALGA